MALITREQVAQDGEGVTMIRESCKLRRTLAAGGPAFRAEVAKDRAPHVRSSATRKSRPPVSAEALLHPKAMGSFAPPERADAPSSIKKDRSSIALDRLLS
jgi:hypothetical protein